MDSKKVRVVALDEAPGFDVQPTAHELSWITLGTQSGPIPNPERSQPANLLLVKGKGSPWLIDCGDGAMERIACAAFNPTQIQVAFLSHLHLDHIGGLQGLIGLRWFWCSQNVLTIYGPPGTDVTVAGIIRSMQPSVRIGMGIPMPMPTPEEQTRVVIVEDGSDITVDGVRVRAVRNSHFDDPPGHPAESSQSLSYRFDYNGYAIGFTGDTGPCDAVADLEKGVDVLVSEVMAVPAMVEFMQHNSKVVFSPEQRAATIQHFETQHLTPQEAGKLAAQAGAQELVLTHLGVPGPTNVWAPMLIRETHETYQGEVVVAHDLDRF